MRVLHLSSGNQYGGIERVLVASARHRTSAPMDPAYAFCFPGRVSEEIRASGAPVHDLGPVRASRPWTVWRARRRLARLLAVGGFDVAVTHACWPHAMFAPVVRHARVRLAHFVHGVLGSGHWTERRAARTVPDVLIANGRFTATTVGRVFPSLAPVVVRCPVELGQASADRDVTRSRIAVARDAFVILLAARIEAGKGHDVLIDALARLPDLGPLECWIAGGPHGSIGRRVLENLTRRVVGSGVGSRVRWLGERADVPDLLAAADVLCQPNTAPESFGVGFVEALAAGVPVVTSAIGGALEIVDESCGVLVPPGDVEAVACALRALIVDPARRRSLGAAGPARARGVADPAMRLRELAAALR